MWLSFQHLTECLGWVCGAQDTHTACSWPTCWDAQAYQCWPSARSCRGGMAGGPSNNMSGRPSARCSRDRMLKLLLYSAMMEQAGEEGRFFPPDFPFSSLQAWITLHNHLQLLMTMRHISYFSAFLFFGLIQRESLFQCTKMCLGKPGPKTLHDHSSLAFGLRGGAGKHCASRAGQGLMAWLLHRVCGIAALPTLQACRPRQQTDMALPGL